MNIQMAGKRYVVWCKKSKYKYVSKVGLKDHKRIKIKWRAQISDYNRLSKGKSPYSSYCGFFDTEREAAIAVDKAMLRIGRNPVNILKSKKQ